MVTELKHLGFFEKEINSIFYIAKPDNVKRVHSTKEQREEAKRLASKRYIPKKDALHSVLARDNDAQLITRDRHYEKLKDISIAKIPEDFI